jgi:hypothetical protein
VEETSGSKRSAIWSLVDEERYYTLSTIDYIASGQDGYSVISAYATNKQTTGRTAEDVRSIPIPFPCVPLLFC